MRRSRGASPSLLEEEEGCLDKNILVTLLELSPKTQDFQMYKRHNILSLGPKSGRAQYGEGQRGGKNGKDKKGGENERSEKGRRDHCGNKVNLIVKKNSGFEASVYHHKIYRYYQGVIVLG